jgi:hypothetical protein
MSQASQEDSRQREISMFAKLASGEDFQDVSSEEKNDSSMDSKAMFAAAAQQDFGANNAGTFCMSSSPNVHKAAASSNLDAAVAALTNGDESLELLDTDVPLPQEVNFRQAPVRPTAEPTPMYNEKVLLPRPLFFGAILPPRVIKEAREAVANAMKERNLDMSKRPRLSQLPPHVRNVVGAIESFGYGISVFPSDVKEDDSYRGTEYVSTFQPVYGDVARAERERLLSIYRAGQPAEPSDATGSTTCENSVVTSEAGQNTSGEGSASSSIVQQQTHGDETNIVGSGSFPERTSPNQVAKSILLRSKSAPVAGAKAPPMSDKDQFLQWARGKPVSPARHAGKPNDVLKKTPPNEKELFSQWARGKSASPELDIVTSKSASDLPPNGGADKDLFSKWARGEADHSPVVTESRKVDTVDGTGSDVDVFSKWAQGGGGSESPSTTPKSNDDLIMTEAASSNKPVPISDKNQFARWAQGGGGSESPSTTPKSNDDLIKTEAASKNQFARWAQGGGGSESPSTTPKSNDSKVTNDEPTLSDKLVPISDKKQFAQWAQGGSPTNTPAPTEGKKIQDSDTAQAEKDLFAKWASGEPSDPSSSSPESAASVKGDSTDSANDKSAPVSEQDTFSQWARAGQDDTATSSSASKATTQQPFDTFRALPDSTVDDYSDDDSVDRSELKKKVGVNENINSALASLATQDGRSMPVGADSIGAEEANALLAQIGATTEGGRPLSNFEITNGLVPLFGIDDSALPAEADLGIFQTKEEQMRSIEQRRSQEIIDKHTYPNIYGPVACPNPAHGPDDSHSWNSRNVPSRKHLIPPGATGHQTSGPGIVPVLDSSPVKPKKKQGSGKQSPASVDDSAADRRERSRSIDTGTPSAYSTSSRSRDGTSKSSRRHRKNQSRGLASFDANARYGWWSMSEQHASTTDDFDDEQPTLVQLPHLEPRPSTTTEVATGLTPSSKFLREENMPLSQLHSATSVAGALPFLSDRPPSFRYLQIDTEAVGFPALGGEIEPLFCSLAIYHVESTTSSHDPRAAPVPNMQRCGRVTEVLTFDAVRDPGVEAACSGSLWPFSTPSSSSAAAHSDQATQGSRCGVFPLASNLNVSNLYAILIVHKVLSDSEDAAVYTNPAKTDSKGAALPSGVDINKFRGRAAKASSRQGDFLMPFAFGVAPLLQIFGTDVPTSVNSRAVQIPLFKFANGYGDRPIIDHIMVMLYPR